MNLKKNLSIALELHSNLLQAETQAISAKDLSTIEDILVQKDESLEILISAKNLVEESSDPYPELQKLVKDVLDHQAKNAENFRKLHVQKGDITSVIDSSNTLNNRVAKAYRQ